MGFSMWDVGNGLFCSAWRRNEKRGGVSWNCKCDLVDTVDTTMVMGFRMYGYRAVRNWGYLGKINGRAIFIYLWLFGKLVP